MPIIEPYETTISSFFFSKNYIGNMLANLIVEIYVSVVLWTNIFLHDDDVDRIVSCMAWKMVIISKTIELGQAR